MAKRSSASVGEILELRIEALAPTGLGTGRYEVDGGNMAVFVPHTAPEDLVRCRITRTYKRYAEAELVEVIQPSPYRVDPICPHFFECGSCSLMHIDYAKQLEFKADAASFVLRRAGLPEPNEVIQASEPLGYRSRAEINCLISKSEGLKVGYFVRRSQRIVSLSECKVLVPACENALKALPDLLTHYSPPVSHLPNELYFKTAIFWEYPHDSALVWVRLKRKYRGGMPQLYRVSGQRIEPLTDAEPLFRFPSAGKLLWAHPNSFTQVNWTANSRLVSEVIEIARKTAPKRILELHSGVGNFTVHLAGLAESVVAIEAGKAEASLLKKNLDEFGRENVLVRRSKDHIALRKLAEQKQRFDLLVCDPPRGGMGSETVRWIPQLSPAHIIYVSCNPVSLARDLKILVNGGFSIVSIKLLDLFPQTPHVESVVWLVSGK